MADPTMNPAMNPTTEEEVVEELDDGQPIEDRAAEEEGRIFPCESCGADLRFHVGQQALKCEHCGHTVEISTDPDADLVEQDFHAMVLRMSEIHARDDGAEGDDEKREIACRSCAAVVEFVGSLTSTECAYCGSPVQESEAKAAEERVPVDGVLPFQVKREKARANLKKWIQSRWFAPNAFKKRGIEGRFSGVYLPYWTFDSMTFTRYTGQRGEYYYVTVGSGDNKRQERRTRWYPASGSFQRFFDDVLVVATRSLETKLLRKLEPWPLRRCIPYNQEVVAGFLAKTYEVELEPGFGDARKRIKSALTADVRRRIGGDTQRIHSLNTRYDAVTFKHLLLPVWLLGYRYGKKNYQVVVNAATGEVQGERPWSFWKILFAVLLVAAVAGGIALGISLSE